MTHAAGMTTKEMKSFMTKWEEYEDTITHLLPRFIVRGQSDLTDDLDHALFCRDKLEQLFDAYRDDPRLVPYRARILGIDADLVLLRRDFLDGYPLDAYRAARERAGVTRSHWWWYLDEIAVPADEEAPSPDLDRDVRLAAAG